MRFIIAACFMAALPTLAFAQTENTVEDWSWTVDHHEQSGQWISACDHRDDKGTKIERCYMSLVEVYAPRPQFGAAFVFVTPQTAGNLKFEFRFERGTLFKQDGFQIVRDQAPVWTYDTTLCPDLKCFIEGEEAGKLANMLSGPGALQISFKDRYRRDFDLVWQNAGFAEMLADFRKAVAERGL